MNETPLDRESFERAISILGERDRDLREVVTTRGEPPMWVREPGYPTLVRIILEQQVSLASARAAFGRLERRLQPIDPGEFLTLDDQELKKIGFSRQKTRYCRILAEAIRNGSIDLTAFQELGERQIRERLMEIPGVGPWTVDIYLLMVLRWPDIWPSGDLALAAAVADLKKLESRPTSAELDVIAQPWRPWRAVAARILWHHYLETGLRTRGSRGDQSPTTTLQPVASPDSKPSEKTAPGLTKR